MIRRVRCSMGHWSAVRLVLLGDLRTYVLPSGSRCHVCRGHLT